MLGGSDDELLAGGLQFLKRAKVFGTRTAREFVWEGANMGIFLKWGNYAVGKLMEFLFNTNFLAPPVTQPVTSRGPKDPWAYPRTLPKPPT